MTETTEKAEGKAEDKAAVSPADKGTGFLFWGWVAVTILNLGMVSGSLVLFAP